MTQPFEDNPAPCKLMTFDGIDPFLAKNVGNICSPIEGMVDDAGRLTNFALVLSDQNPWCIGVTSKYGCEWMSGPLVTQIDAAMNFITANNPPIEIKKRGGMYRRFPSIAVKEALVNSIIHSDLSIEERITVEMNDDMLSVRSPGGMFVPDEWKDVTSTNPRNRRLAKLMVDARYASLKGRGLMLIKNCYTGSGLMPCIIQDGRSFTVRLPAMDAPVKDERTGDQLVVEYLGRKRGALISDISRDLMVSVYYSRKIIERLESDGMVFTMGIGSQRRAFLTGSPEKNAYRETMDAQIRE